MSHPDSDRRQGDRRRTERRQDSASAAGPSSGERRRGANAQESLFDPIWQVDSVASGGAAREGTQELRDSAMARVHRTYAAARAAVGLGLVASQVAVGLLGSRGPVSVTLIAMAYALQALTLWLLPRYEPLALPQSKPGLRRRQWLATVGVDLLAFGALHALESGTSFNFTALLVLPVLMGGVTTQRLMALATASVVTMFLLAVAWHGPGGGNEAANAMLQSGLVGLGFFAIAMMAGELANRLAREEEAARGNMELARQQVMLNRLVIEEMADGVLVVDLRQRVRAANPAARALLVAQGLCSPAPFMLTANPSWHALAQSVASALNETQWPEEGRDVTLTFDGGFTRTLRMRVRFTRGAALVEGAPGSDPLAVLLLEDVRTAQARVRQEKLAAMGRVSAGIAHEIRNPLAAISQANALMLEEGMPATQQRLAQMVADNVERLKRLVDDVMEIAPGGEPSLRVIDARSELGVGAAEWAAAAQLVLGSECVLRVELPTTPLGVMFDPEHLRRILVNLLDNALRHASGRPGAVFLRLVERDAQVVQFSVLSDSALIPPDVERYLFEPFFSTRSRGSGLGLYICRELCQRYGASIEYRARPAAERLRNEFIVTLRRGGLPAGELALSLDP